MVNEGDIQEPKKQGGRRKNSPFNNFIPNNVRDWAKRESSISKHRNFAYGISEKNKDKRAHEGSTHFK